jgi:DNA-binding transcriptional ArsR family regulator
MSNPPVTRSSADAAFYALADPTRRAVLDMLRQGRQPAGEIAQAFSVSRPAISKHLQLLLRAELVTADCQGRHRYYRLNPGPLVAVDAWLARYRQFWAARVTRLKSFVETGEPRAATPAARKRRSMRTPRN